jgi:hypothetical protein
MWITTWKSFSTQQPDGYTKILILTSLIILKVFGIKAPLFQRSEKRNMIPHKIDIYMRVAMHKTPQYQQT